MAEKEERQKRLLVKEYDLICDLTDCEYCEEKDWCCEKDGMTLQEAIRKMCDAYFKAKDKGAMESERVVAALNALLEAEK